MLNAVTVIAAKGEPTAVELSARSYSAFLARLRLLYVNQRSGSHWQAPSAQLGKKAQAINKFRPTE